MTAIDMPVAGSRPKPRMHPLAVRVMHWTNAIAMVVMIGSGWKIYNDEVIFGFLHFPQEIVLGIWAQHALQWHFFGMWILMLNGLVYLAYGLISGRFRRLLWPIRPLEVVREALAALTFRLKHADLTHYNAVQKVLYVGVMAVIIVQVITGLAIWKPVQFSGLVSLFGGFQGARLAHFIGMALIVGFMVVHVALALLVPKTILAMLTGGPRVDPAPPTTPPAH
ncbi:cytochrome b/b6 domain-containing protein [Azorhizobium sp. AG788]|uniref:cytochrome b/b6 domain-containing protein n=1 Tax=Azorhizobium sp. AG788 TaxID=2183897 RepID=UPI00313A1183